MWLLETFYNLKSNVWLTGRRTLSWFEFTLIIWYHHSVLRSTYLPGKKNILFNHNEKKRETKGCHCNQPYNLVLCMQSKLEKMGLISLHVSFWGLFKITWIVCKKMYKYWASPSKLHNEAFWYTDNAPAPLLIKS